MCWVPTSFNINFLFSSFLVNLVLIVFHFVQLKLLNDTYLIWNNVLLKDKFICHSINLINLSFDDELLIVVEIIFYLFYI